MMENHGKNGKAGAVGDTLRYRYLLSKQEIVIAATVELRIKAPPEVLAAVVKRLEMVSRLPVRTDAFSALNEAVLSDEFAPILGAPDSALRLWGETEEFALGKDVVPVLWPEKGCSFGVSCTPAGLYVELNVPGDND